MKRSHLFNFSTLELSVRIFTAFFVSVYGMAKPFQFSGGLSVRDVAISKLNGMELMWAFFGYSLAYPVVIGLIQVTGAILLVFERTKLIAALLLTPVFLNIIFLDVVFEVHQGALINAIVFQIVFLYIIWQHRSKVALLIQHLTIQNIAFNTTKERLVKFIIASVIGAFLFFGYSYLLNRL